MATKKLLKKLIINGETHYLPSEEEYVDKASNQSVGGVKTFTNEPVLPSKTSDATNSGTKPATEAQVYKKQDTLIPGSNITIGNDGKTISATDTTYQQVTKNDMDTGTGTTAGVVSAKDIADFVAGKVGTAVNYKGQVADYDHLPTTGLTAGDMYNVVAAHTTAPKFDAGTNVVWSGSAWDPMAEMVDLSNLVDKTTNQTIGGTKTFSNEPVLPSKTSDATNNGTKPATEAQVYKKLDSSDLGNATITFDQGKTSGVGSLTANQSTNGTIKLQGNVPMTQADYNDEPSTKTTDGNTYMIYEVVTTS